MIIGAYEYQAFYEILRTVFIRKEYGDDIPKKTRGINSPTIWEKKDDQGRYISLLRFEGGATQDPRYFYRLHSKYKIGVVNSGEVDDLAFMKALKYIGINLPASAKPTRTLPLKDELTLLYDQFRINYIVSKDELDIDDKSQNKYSKQTEIIDTFNESFDEVERVIKTFFKNISLRDFDKAWDLLSLEIKKRAHRNNYNRFEVAYLNTRGIRDLFITSMRQTSDTKIDCIISYEDEIDAYTSIELDSLSLMTVKNLEEFVRIIRKLQQDVSESGGKNFDKIELYKFFEPAPSEYIWHRCEIDPNDLPEIFPNRRTVYLKRSYSCTCNLIEGKWLIERIIPIPIASSR